MSSCIGYDSGQHRSLPIKCSSIRSTTLAVSCLKYCTWVEVTDSDKHSSLLQCRFNYDRNMFYNTSPDETHFFSLFLYFFISFFLSLLLSFIISFFHYLLETKSDLKNCCSSFDCCPDVLAMTMDNIGVYP